MHKKINFSQWLVSSQFFKSLQQLFSVMNNNEIVIVHHHCQRLSDDHAQPDQEVAAARTPLVLHVAGQVNQRNLKYTVVQ